jgi:hypothetical protein
MFKFEEFLNKVRYIANYHELWIRLAALKGYADNPRALGRNLQEAIHVVLSDLNVILCSEHPGFRAPGFTMFQNMEGISCSSVPELKGAEHISPNTSDMLRPLYLRLTSLQHSATTYFFEGAIHAVATAFCNSDHLQMMRLGTAGPQAADAAAVRECCTTLF